VRSEAIVFLTPVLDFLLRIGQRQKPVHVQALVAKATVKRFNVRIICRFAWAGEVERDVLVIGPTVQGFADKLAAIIDLDALGHQAQFLV
jgi:hypothetical protein